MCLNLNFTKSLLHFLTFEYFMHTYSYIIHFIVIIYLYIGTYNTLFAILYYKLNYTFKYLPG